MLTLRPWRQTIRWTPSGTVPQKPRRIGARCPTSIADRTMLCPLATQRCHIAHGEDEGLLVFLCGKAEKEKPPTNRELLS
jgi:hypothetical protein